MNNPIINEIREARAALAKEHDYDLVRINEWAKKKSEERAKAKQMKQCEQVGGGNASRATP